MEALAKEWIKSAPAPSNSTTAPTNPNAPTDPAAPTNSTQSPAALVDPPADPANVSAKENAAKRTEDFGDEAYTYDANGNEITKEEWYKL